MKRTLVIITLALLSLPGLAQAQGWMASVNNQAIFTGTVARPQVTGSDLGTSTYRWDAFLRTVNISGTITGSGVWLLADGTVAAPSLAFASDTDTGAYRPSANEFGIAAGGVIAAAFASTGTSIYWDGSLRARFNSSSGYHGLDIASYAIKFGTAIGTSTVFLTSRAASTLALETTGSNPILQFGGATSSFPALKRSGTMLQFRLADDSGYASLIAQNVESNGVSSFSTGTAIPAGGSTSARVVVSSTAGFGLYFGSGAPTVTAAKGSLYLRSDGSTTNDRAYINTDGGTTWTPLTTGS